MNKFEKLSEALDVEYEPSDYDEVVIQEKDITQVKTQEPTANLPAVIISEDENVAEKEDFLHSREKLRQIIDIGQESLKGIASVASQSDEPRAYEVIAIQIKSLNESIKTLYELHATRKRVKEGRIEEPSQTFNVDKAVFVGTGADLLAQVKKEQREENDNPTIQQ